MANTLGLFLDEVRRLIGDRSLNDPVCTDPMLEELTDLSTQELADEIGGGLTVTTGFVTLSAGVGTYEITGLTTGVSPLYLIQHLENLVLASTEYQLDQKNLDFILNMRVNNTEARGVPRYYCLRENQQSSKTYLEIWPEPAVDDSLTAYWKPIHLRTVQGITNQTTQTLRFSVPAIAALRARVAGKAIAALAPEALAKLTPPKSPAFGQLLLQQSLSLAQAEFARIHASEYPDVVQRTR